MNTNKLIFLTGLVISLGTLSKNTCYAMEQEDKEIEKNTIFSTLINKTENTVVAFIPIQYPNKIIRYKHKVNKNSSIILGINNLVQKEHFDTIPSTDVLIIKTKNQEYVLTHGDYRGQGHNGYPYTKSLWCFEKKQAQTLSPESNTFTLIKKKLRKSEEGLLVNSNFSIITYSLNKLSLSDNNQQDALLKGPYLIDIIITDDGLSAVFKKK
jgi:hypothetical protein